MNSKDNKKQNLIFILLKNSTPITIKEIAIKLNTSQKTIRNYLDELKSTFDRLEITLIRKPGVGIYIEADQNQKKKLIYNFTFKNNNTYSKDYRQKYILKTLFNNRYTYTIQLLADDLYCSKSTIINDLNYVEKWLEIHGLQLKRKQNKGLWIAGNENTFRNSMMSLFSELNNEADSSQKNCDEMHKELDYRIDSSNYKKIMQFFPSLDIFKVQKIIQKSEEKLGYYFTDQAFINLIVHIAITLERAKFNKKIDIDHDYLKNIEMNKEFKIAVLVVNELNKTFKLKIPKEESAYICLHMLGAKIQYNVYPYTLSNIINSKKELNVEIANKIINLVSDILNINLRNDKLLLANLSIHLRTTIIRLKYGLQLRNPILKKIKEEYLSIFGATYSCSIIFENELGISINEDEIGYISLHIAAAVERMNSKIKVVVICSSGIGTSQIIATRLSKKFPQIDISAILPLRYLTEDIINSTDLIISTVPVNINTKKIVYTSTFLDEKDETIIRKYLENIHLDANIDAKNEYLDDIISSNYCFIDDGCEPYLEIIKKYANIMEQSGIAKSGFYKNVIQREQNSSTIIGKGIAIPHSNEQFILHPKIGIVKLNNPVVWKNEYIDLIFILALKFKNINSTRTFFKKFYSLLDNEELINKIKKSATKSELISFFSNLNKYI